MTTYSGTAVQSTSAARSGMANLITELRGLTEAGTADYTVGAATYWDDGQLQNILDIYRIDYIHAPLIPYPVVGTSGTSLYYEYRFNAGYFEQTTGGTAILYLQNGTGTQMGTSLWSADYRRGVFTFSADQMGTAYYITGRSYDLNAAAAAVWRKKAAHYAPTSFNFSTDNHSISRSQVYDHAIDMVKFFTGISNGAIQTVQMTRSDTWD